MFSEGVFHGEVSVDPDKLQELDTVNQETVKLSDGQVRKLERLRDAQKVTMLFDNKMAFQIIMGMEGQAGANYYMPVRCMELDALLYSYQCREISRKRDRRGKGKPIGRSFDRSRKGGRFSEITV